MQIVFIDERNRPYVYCPLCSELLMLPEVDENNRPYYSKEVVCTDCDNLCIEVSWEGNPQ